MYKSKGPYGIFRLYVHLRLYTRVYVILKTCIHVYLDSRGFEDSIHSILERRFFLSYFWFFSPLPRWGFSRGGHSITFFLHPTWLAVVLKLLLKSLGKGRDGSRKPRHNNFWYFSFEFITRILPVYTRSTRGLPKSEWICHDLTLSIMRNKRNIKFTWKHESKNDQDFDRKLFDFVTLIEEKLIKFRESSVEFSFNLTQSFS